MEDGPPRIRLATMADVPRLAELTATLGYRVAARDLHPRIERILSKPDQAMYVAEIGSGGVVVGWILGAEQEWLETGRRCEILGLVVAEAGRRRGIGTLLVQVVEAWGRDRGLDRVVVRSNVIREASHPFYGRLGYERVKTQHVYHKALR